MIPPGAANILEEARAGVTNAAASDDEDEEREAYEAGLLAESAEADGIDDDYSDDEDDVKTVLNSDAVHQTVKLASRNVITPRTLSAYQRQWKLFTAFLVDHEFLQPDEKLDPKNLPSQLPEYICIWIMDKCDNIDIYTNKNKPLGYEPSTYSYAQQMRAAMTHHFGRELGLGLGSWTESEVNPGRYLGNPSLSTVVGQYMISLRRKKTKAGEVVTSARAIEEPVLHQLYDFNQAVPKQEFSRQKRPKQETEGVNHNWAGRNIRMMLTLLYILAFMCLLRYDEALRIQWSDLILTRMPDSNVFRLEIRLPFRKTHQTGGIQPFFLYSNHEKPWLCPIRAYAEWAQLMKDWGMPLQGYVFRARVGLDSISSNPQFQMTSQAFLECFRNNLCDIRVDPRYYGTHSFRRGGCQYLSIVLRWSFRCICDWGGWAPTFDNPGTLFKYLLSWVDNPRQQREDFFSPNRPQTDACSACGRTCLCS